VHSECKDGWFWQCVISSSKEVTSDEESDITISEYQGVCKCSGCKCLFSCDSQRAVRQFERTVFTRVVFFFVHIDLGGSFATSVGISLFLSSLLFSATHFCICESVYDF
jgi:hypothetical protein